MIEIKHNAQQVAKRIERFAASQLPFATSLALNRTAQRVKAGELAVMRQRFDRPTPFTLNSLMLTPATKTKLVAKVWFRDYATKGTPAQKYLGPEVFGGNRQHKRFERALIAKGYMKPTQFAIPAAGAQLDNFGNVSRGQTTKVMTALRAHGEQGYSANRTTSKRSVRRGRAAQYFVGQPEGESAGIWQKVQTGFGSGIRPVWLFVDRNPRYRVRLAFFKVAENIMRARYAQEFERAIDEAIRTAK